jgi:hypothetical protein
MKLSSLLLLLVAPSMGFKFMSNWKLPSPQDFARQEAIKERFGDKSKVSFVAARLFDTSPAAMIKANMFV